MTSVATASVATSFKQAGPPPARRLSGVDGLRGLAAFIVLIFHIYGNACGGPELRIFHFNVLRPLTDGWAAVNLFLVLSGFCLYWPFAVRADKPTRELRLKEYATRRAMRILPTYYASLIFVSFLGWLTPLRHTEPNCLPHGWLDLVAHLLLLNAWFPTSINSWNSVTWSLSVEWTWYAAFPIAMLLFRRYGAARGMVLLAAITIIYRIALYLIVGHGNQIVPQVSLAWRTFLPGRLFEFGAGMTVASIAAARKTAPKYVHFIGAILILVLLVAARMAEPVDVFLPVRDILYGTASATLLYMVVVPDEGFLKRFAESTLLVWMGEFSYTLYLFHLAFVVAFSLVLKAHGFEGVRLFGALLLTIPITLVACWGLYYIVERPFLVRRPKPTVTPAVVEVA